MSQKLINAIKNEDCIRSLDAIYELGDKIIKRDPEYHFTYLHLLVNFATPQNESRLLPIVYQLSNAGIDVNAVDSRGRTALEMAIEKQCSAILAALIRVGVDISERNYRKLIEESEGERREELQHTYDKFEPGLWAAVARNSVASVHLLVNSWCRIRVKRRKQNLKELAEECGTSKNAIDIRSILYDFELTLELVHATLAGDVDLMVHWLGSGAAIDPHIMDISHQATWRSPPEPRSLRSTAEAMGHVHVLHLLPDEACFDDGGGDTRGFHVSRSQQLFSYPNNSRRKTPGVRRRRKVTHDNVDSDCDVDDSVQVAKLQQSNGASQHQAQIDISRNINGYSHPSRIKKTEEGDLDATVHGTVLKTTDIESPRKLRKRKSKNILKSTTCAIS